MSYRFKWIDSPVGRLQLVASQIGLAAILWNEDFRRFPALAGMTEDAADHLLAQVESQLQNYFSRDRRLFTIPLDLAGTEFQREVWNALSAIPYGALKSYGDIARGIGRPKAVRAVGAAVGMNPISIIVPCHRAVGATGALTGFAGGLPAKSALMALEGMRRQGVLDGIPPTANDRWLAAAS